MSSKGKRYSFDALGIVTLAVQTRNDNQALNVAFELIRRIQADDIPSRQEEETKNSVFHVVAKALLGSSIDELNTFLMSLSRKDCERMVDCLIEEYHMIGQRS